MRITITAVREFVEKVESKAISSVSSTWDKQIAEAKREAFHPHVYKHKQVTGKILELKVLINALCEGVKDDPNLVYDVYYGVKSDVLNLERNVAKFEEYCKYKGQRVVELEVGKKKAVREVKEEYKKVRGCVWSTRSPKKALEMLQEMGFDTSSLTVGTGGALVPQVDKSKLFVCGQNK